MALVWFFSRHGGVALIIRSLRKMQKKVWARRRLTLWKNAFRRGARFMFEPFQIAHGVRERFAAHFPRRAQTRADRGTFGRIENGAAVIIRQLRAAHARGLAVRHSGDGRRNRKRNAARATANAAIHNSRFVSPNIRIIITPRAASKMFDLARMFGATIFAKIKTVLDWGRHYDCDAWVGVSGHPIR